MKQFEERTPAATDDTSEQLELRVANLDCHSDASALRRAMEGATGLERIDVRPTSGTVTLCFDPHRTTAEGLRRRLAEVGFPPRATRGPG